jgi:hypothetical protein
MKTSTAISSLLTLAAVTTVSAERVSYDGYKVVRLSVGREIERVNSIMATLGLTTWKGAPREGAKADIVIPPEAIAAFTAQTVGMDAVTMHEDLGASIAAESGASNSDFVSGMTPPSIPFVTRIFEADQTR